MACGHFFQIQPFQVMELDSLKDYASRRIALQNWFEKNEPSVMIIGYDMFRILTQGDDDKVSTTVIVVFLKQCERKSLDV